MSQIDPELLNLPDVPLVGIQPIIEHLRPWFGRSGRYRHNGGASAREAQPRDGATRKALHDPSVLLERPVLLPDPPIQIHPGFRGPRFTLHIDIDGIDPLSVVSGTVAGPWLLLDQEPAHFTGRVTEDETGDGVRTLVVEDVRFPWPGTSHEIDRLDIELSGMLFAVEAKVTFTASASGFEAGPFNVARESPYFREVEFEIDHEEGAVTDVEPYRTHTHSDRPDDLPDESLTLEKVFARVGIRVTRSPNSGTEIDSPDPDDDDAEGRWSNDELHDAMKEHWSRYKTEPQWKMWIFLARLAESDGLGGVMFDWDIDEPDGVDRQGTAIFTRSPHFHHEDGAYPQANPPAAEAAQRELFFNLIHETGHAFNLAHSWQKEAGDPWDAPDWKPLTDDADALSWMNYPDRPTGNSGQFNASWFYDRFRFRFSDDENLFLRHAPESNVQMGNDAFFINHGRVSRSSLDRRLELLLRTRSTTVAFGETVFVELRLRNTSSEPLLAHTNLDPSDGLVELAVTGPDGQRHPFLPPVHTRSLVRTELLGPNARRYADVKLMVGKLGFPFKQPGYYRIEASYRNVDGRTAAAVLQLRVRAASSYDEDRAVRTLFDAPTGLALAVGGTRTQDDINEKLDWVLARLGPAHPTSYFLEAARAIPMAKPYKVMDLQERRIRRVEPDPERAAETLRPFVDHPSESADAVGHIAYRFFIDRFTDCASRSERPESAREAQQTMLGLFESRGVVEPVVESVRSRVRELS